jgi:hypothetical protein
MNRMFHLCCYFTLHFTNSQWFTNCNVIDNVHLKKGSDGLKIKAIKKMKKLLFIVLIAVLKIAPAFGQSGWQLKSEKEGVKIYTCEVTGSKVKALKVEAAFNATPAQLVALIMDVNKSPDWVYHVKSAALLKRVSPSELYYYSVVSLPWPLADRDFVAHLTVSQNPVTKVITIDGPAVAGLVPVKPGIIRVGDSRGKWVITLLGNNRINVEYSIHLDPGGGLPAWLVNMFATEGPMNIFRNIKTQLQKPAYKNTELALALD